MARKRSASSDDDSDYDHKLAVAQRKQKALKQQTQSKKPVHHVAVRKAPRGSSGGSGSSANNSVKTVVPSRVTPEQIIARAVAAKNQKKQQQQQVLIESSSDAYAMKPEALLVKAENSEPVEDAAMASDEYDEEEEYEEEEEEIAAPVVFQCGTCRSIFGDSYSFVGSNADLLLVTLSAVTNITTTSEPQTSKEGMDMGSSFQELLCSQCQTVLGRKYLTTPVLLDAIRGLFSFATTTIASYQLGYPQLQLQSAMSKEGDALEGVLATSTSFEDMKRATIACDQAVKALSSDRQELLKLREDMTKVQNLLLVVDERLHQLEEEGQDEHDSEAELEGDDAKRR